MGGTIERKASVKNIHIADIPVMVRGNLCNTYNKSHETLIRMEEDPSDPGGYFIVKGHEWIINSIESSTYNKPKIFRNKGHKNEIAYLEIISKPGDSYENSALLHIKMLTGNQLIMTIQRSTCNLNEIQIPFFLLFRLLGWSSDRQIVEWIIYNYDDEISKHILDRLDLAFKAKYTQFNDVLKLHDKGDILHALLNKMTSVFGYLDLDDEKTMRYVNGKIIYAIDNYLLPHIGTTAGDRNEKAIYLAHLIRHLMLVEMKIVEGTDRDSLKNKRAHTGRCFFC